jgi:hypothetical protein
MKMKGDEPCQTGRIEVTRLSTNGNTAREPIASRRLLAARDDIGRDEEGLGGGEVARTDRRSGAAERRDEPGSRNAESADLEHHREITNTAGQPSAGGAPVHERSAPAGDERQSGPEKAGLKEGDDAWHNRSNRKGERGDAEPGRGGNVAR